MTDDSVTVKHIRKTSSVIVKDSGTNKIVPVVEQKTVVINKNGPQGARGLQGQQGERGNDGDASIYDNIIDLTLVFNNGLI